MDATRSPQGPQERLRYIQQCIAENDQQQRDLLSRLTASQKRSHQLEEMLKDCKAAVRAEQAEAPLDVRQRVLAVLRQGPATARAISAASKLSLRSVYSIIWKANREGYDIRSLSNSPKVSEPGMYQLMKEPA